MGTRRDGTRQGPFTIYSDRGIACLNTRIRGQRFRPSLGLPYFPNVTRGEALREVEEAAAAKYAELVAGRVLVAGPEARVLSAHTLEELGDTWLEEAAVMWPKSIETRTTQFSNVVTWATTAARFAKDRRTPIERVVDDAGPTQYATDRLGEVLRETITKEVSNLYTFFAWAIRERHIAAIPPRPELPKGVEGTRSGPQRAEPVDVTAEEVLAICAELPEYTRRGGRGQIDPANPPKGAIVVRDAFRLAWELALRPGDVQTFEVPRHWMRGQPYVAFRGDDKTGSKDKIALTRVAREILERHAPKSGRIFDEHDLRVQIKRAAEKVLGPVRAKTFAAYDFRHARLTHVVEVTGDLLGASALARHRRPTTINRYVRPQERHVTRVIAALDAVSTRSGEALEAVASASAGESNPEQSQALVRRRGLEPLRCYPLAPQAAEHEWFSRVGLADEHQPTSPDVGDCDSSDTERSARGQEALRRALHGLTVERAVWDGYDAIGLDEVSTSTPAEVQ